MSLNCKFYRNRMSIFIIKHNILIIVFSTKEEEKMAYFGLWALSKLKKILILNYLFRTKVSLAY
jgi:hypothetical protein